MRVSSRRLTVRRTPPRVRWQPPRLSSRGLYGKSTKVETIYGITFRAGDADERLRRIDRKAAAAAAVQGAARTVGRDSSLNGRAPSWRDAAGGASSKAGITAASYRETPVMSQSGKSNPIFLGAMAEGTVGHFQKVCGLTAHSAGGFQSGLQVLLFQL